MVKATPNSKTSSFSNAAVANKHAPINNNKKQSDTEDNNLIDQNKNLEKGVDNV